MRVKQFEIRLNEQFYIAVEIESLAGQITRFVVRLMKTGDPDANITRYDIAHNCPHRAVIGKKKGLLRKDWLVGMTPKVALQMAINDLKMNYERYDQIYKNN